MNKRVECSYQRCHRRATDTGRCKSHEKQHKDREFSEYIRNRDPRCVARDWTPPECDGNLQCAHIISRSYLKTRWDPENAIGLCAAHHTYWTHHPQEFIQWCHDSQEVDYWALHQRALGIPA